MDLILQPWPWYITGPLLAIVMFLLIYFGKTFGMSSNLRTFCAMAGAGKKSDFFKIDYKTQKWNLMVVFGAVIGGFIAHFFLSNETNIQLNPHTIEKLQSFVFENIGKALVPPEIYNWDAVFSSFHCWINTLKGHGQRRKSRDHHDCGLDYPNYPVPNVFPDYLLYQNLSFPHCIL